MGGGGKSVAAPAPAPQVPETPVIDTAAERRAAEEEERERRRRAAIAASGRASTILAGDEPGTGKSVKLLGE